MKLIGSLTSPYVRKVRIVMAEKKLDFQHELEDVWASDKILASNPLGKVPCLVLPGGEAIFDSRVIVEYLDTRSPVSRLIPESSRERIEVRTGRRWPTASWTRPSSPGSNRTGLAAPPSSAARPGSTGNCARSMPR
jgi:glutathione S-transferase